MNFILQKKQEKVYFAQVYNRGFHQLYTHLI